jgi:aldehyde dehydrogenase (NAD+)
MASPKPIMDCAAASQRLRAFFQTGATRSVDFRRTQLRRLAGALERHEAALLSALQADLRKSPRQGYSTEIGMVQAEICHAQKHLARWASPQRRRTPWFVAPARGCVQSEPFGVALILGPWNYPVQLLLTPLVCAIAAGNCAVLKPSELAPRTAEAIAELMRDCFDEQLVMVVTGGADVAEALLRERFDKIFFTGSTRVGRMVMTAAAKHLTPVTLELGGKCPAIVCADAFLALAARRIAWGKFMNAGQTCVAPDWVLVERAARGPFVAAMKQALRKFYGDDPARSEDYGRIVNQAHFERLVNYLGDGKVLHGGQHEAKALFIAPTILAGVAPDAAVMQEEMFGPILPVLEFDRLDDALAMLRDRPTPLALYVFTRDRAVERRVLAETRSGGACVNDVVSHMIGTGLPFGGLGESGLGAYHGHAGFEAFSHQRSVLRRATWLDTPFRYPPQKLSLPGLKRAMRFLLRD